MAAQKKPRRTAARDEVQDGPRVVKWNDIELEVPKEMPVVTALKLRRMARTDRIDHAADVIESIIGERQMLAVEAVLADVPESKISDEISDLISACLKEFGTAEGE